MLISQKLLKMKILDSSSYNINKKTKQQGKNTQPVAKASLPSAQAHRLCS